VARPSYHPVVQNLTLVMIALIVGTVAVVATVVVLERRGRITPLQVMLGLAIGAVGAFFVLVSRIDLVPDGPEDGLQRLFVVLVTIGAVLGTWYRIARA
jgi:zinc transporter ZupT